jgi:hypothetical protein
VERAAGWRVCGYLVLGGGGVVGGAGGRGGGQALAVDVHHHLRWQARDRDRGDRHHPTNCGRGSTRLPPIAPGEQGAWTQPDVIPVLPPALATCLGLCLSFRGVPAWPALPGKGSHALTCATSQDSWRSRERGLWRGSEFDDECSPAPVAPPLPLTAVDTHTHTPKRRYGQAARMMCVRVYHGCLDDTPPGS